MNPYVLTTILPFVLAGILVAVLVQYLSPIARDIGLVDRPNERKQHEKEIPLVGGITILTGFYLSLFLVPFGLGPFRYLLFAIALLVIVGVFDDHQDISPLIKFGMQIVAALILIADGAVVTAVGDVFNWQDGNLQGLGYLSKPLTILAIVGLINAYNFIDGHDGLSASMLLLSLLVLVYICGINDEWKMQYFLLLYLFSVMVFLLFNLPFSLVKSRQIFLGDAGSMMFGLIMIYVLIDLAERPVPALKATCAPWIVGLPLLDMLAVIFKRLRRRRSPTSPDRSHIHHILTDLGLSKGRVLIVLIFTQTILVAIGLFGMKLSIPDWLMFWSMLPVMMVYILVVNYLSNKATMSD